MNKMKPPNNPFGAILRSIRLKKHLTQAQIAAQMGITQKALSHKETGRNPITLTEFVRFAETYAPEITEELKRQVSLTGYIMLTFFFAKVLKFIHARQTQQDFNPLPNFPKTS
jgi:transcriptional regulator with XRE-family HTH domain